MLVRLAYLMVILIWATTPLAIKLGGDTLSPIAGLTLRMVLAFSVGCMVSTLFGFRGLTFRRHGRLYFAASISLFPNMALVYVAAQYLPSGLISLMFGLTPFFTVILALPILGENLWQPRKVVAIALGFGGLLCILLDNISLGDKGCVGLGLMLLSNLLFSGSALWVKKLNAEMTVEPLEQALGAMAFSLPGLVLSWVLLPGFVTPQFSPQSLASLLYLALIASLLGFVAYYFILRNLTVETVSLIPLITPVLAIGIGAWLAEEVLSLAMLAGAALILLGLLVHQGRGLDRLLFKSRRAIVTREADAA